MGFRKGAYAKVWEVVPMSDTSTKLRISTRSKNKKTDEYEQDFSGFVLCVGSGVASKAAKLSSGDSIRIGDTDVTTRYDREKKIEYVNYKIFSFEDPGNGPAGGDRTDPQPEVDSGEVSEDEAGGQGRKLPF